MLRSIHPKSRVMMGNLNIAMMTSDYDIKKGHKLKPPGAATFSPTKLQKNIATAHILGTDASKVWPLPAYHSLWIWTTTTPFAVMMFETKTPHNAWAHKGAFNEFSPSDPNTYLPSRVVSVQGVSLLLDGVDFGGKLRTPRKQKKTYQWNSTPLFGGSI